MPWLTKTLERWPDDEDSHGNVVVSAGAPQAMIAESRRRLIEDFPQSSATLGLLAREARARNDLSLGEDYARKAIEATPESSLNWTQLAVFLMVQGRMDEADQAATKALTFNRRQNTAWQVLSNAAKQQGALAKAESCKKHAEECMPFLRGFSTIDQANALLGQSRCREAISLVAPLRNGKLPQLRRAALHTHGRALLTVGSVSELVEAKRDFEDAKTESSIYFAVCARLAQLQGNIGLEIRTLECGYDKHPRSGILGSRLLYALGRAKDFARARALAARLPEEMANHPSEAALVYFALDALGFRAEAERARNAVRTQFRTHETWRYIEARAMMKAGFHREAIEIASSIHGPMRAAAGVVKAQAKWGSVCDPRSWFRRSG